jgi:hypothetical protein
MCLVANNAMFVLSSIQIKVFLVVKFQHVCHQKKSNCVLYKGFILKESPQIHHILIEKQVEIAIFRP